MSIILFLIFDKNEFNAEKICAITLIAILALIGLVYTFYLFSYKIIIRSEGFSVRKFFIIKTFEINDITNIEYKRVAFGDYTYVVKFKNGKMEVSQLLKDKALIDRVLAEKGFFKKFPRINY